MRIHIRVRNHKTLPGRQAFMISLVISIGLYLLLSFLPKSKTSDTAAGEPDRIDRMLPPLSEQVFTISRGQTLSDLLDPFGFSPADIHQLKTDIQSVYDPAKIKAGRKLRLFTHPNGEFAYLEYDIDSEKYLHITRNSDRYDGEIRYYPYETRIALIWGIIEDIPINAIVAAGENVQLAIELAELFAWDIDFYADIRTGDSFRVIFEKKYLRGEFIGYGSILAAEFINQAKIFEAFRYTYEDEKKSDYFDFEGNSLRKEFLKSPLNGARITSRFSHSRLHPIRKVFRPHFGVDYAAPVGTPVQATASGTVIFVGRNGGAGRMVKIRHMNRYETLYLHLSRFGNGIRNGAKVQSGQIIGYVGSSGESSGPHLDYRITYHGQYINPLSHRFKPVAPLAKEYLPDFQDSAWAMRFALDGPLFVMRLLTNNLFNPAAAAAGSD